jgi:hypothetical protein
MDQVSHNVCDITASDRRALEHLVGQRLADDQQVVIQVVAATGKHPQNPDAISNSESNTPPTYWRVFDGLSAEQTQQLDATLQQRPNFSRPIAE